MSYSKQTILLCTQGTYPHNRGGVSVWCDALINGLTDHNFILYSVTGHTDVRPVYQVPRNVSQHLHVPLWGVSDVTAHFNRSHSRRFKRRALNTVFLPLLSKLMTSLLDPAFQIDGIDEVLAGLWQYFQEYDWNITWSTPQTWRLLLEFLERSRDQIGLMPTLADADTALNILQHYFLPLGVPIPDHIDVVHNTCAAYTGVIGVVAKIIRNVPMILTEHGIFIKEQYTYIGEDGLLSPYVKRFVVRLHHWFCRLNYAYADIVCPVTKYNKRWETQIGIAGSSIEEKINVINNGVDMRVFTSRPKPALYDGMNIEQRPIVISTGGVVPLKDIETMIQSARIVREQIPNILFLVYGSIDYDPAYVQRCQDLIDKLDLQENFRLCGYTDRPQDIYPLGDLSLCTSLSEGFPFSVLESLACERPVVSTDVGGISEMLEGCGRLTEIRDAAGIASNIIELLDDEALRREMGVRGRQRVLDNYPIQSFLSQYEQIYENLLVRSME